MVPEYYTDKKFYSAPDALPAGFLEIIQPIASWFFKELVTAYDNGYRAGRADAAVAHIKELDRKAAKRAASH